MILLMIFVVLGALLPLVLLLQEKPPAAANFQFRMNSHYRKPSTLFQMIHPDDAPNLKALFDSQEEGSSLTDSSVNNENYFPWLEDIRMPEKAYPLTPTPNDMMNAIPADGRFRTFQAGIVRPVLQKRLKPNLQGVIRSAAKESDKDKFNTI